MFHAGLRSSARFLWYFSILLASASVAMLVVDAAAAQGTENETAAAGTVASEGPTSDDKNDDENDAAKSEEEPETNSTESVQETVDKEVEEKTADQRQKLVKEAVSAVEMTREALASLDDENPHDALDTLAKITGKLELLVARDPSLSVVPVGVATKIYDVFAEVDTIELAIENAQEALDDGDVQRARRLLDGLASEVVISTTKLPLATYPDAIKRVAPLIDDGKIDEAKQQLQSALNLLIVTDVVYPLPELRAEAMIDEAQELSEKSDRSEEENDRLEELMNEVRTQVEFGRKLGYFTEENADDIYDELEVLQEKTSDGKSGKGFFEKIKGLFDW